MLVSVIIPCRNETNYIAECVHAIYSSVNIDFTTIEVIIVDGKSNDGTLQIIEQLQLQYSSLKLIENTLQLTPYAFNLGINNSTGAYVQIIGARQIVSPNYIASAVQTFVSNPNIWCVGGKVINVYETIDSATIAAAMSSWFGVGRGNFRILQQSAFVDTVGTPMYPRTVFSIIGLFDEALIRNQDDDYNYRVTSAGGKIYLNAEMTIKYYVRASFKNLFKQYYQYGYWKVFVNTKHKTITTLRQLVPALLVLYVLLGSLLALFNTIICMLFVIGLLVYLTTAVYAATKVKTNELQLIKIICSFFILHFSYGLGYIEGIINFVVFRNKPKANNTTLSR